MYSKISYSFQVVRMSTRQGRGMHNTTTNERAIETGRTTIVDEAVPVQPRVKFGRLCEDYTRLGGKPFKENRINNGSSNLVNLTL